MPPSEEGVDRNTALREIFSEPGNLRERAEADWNLDKLLADLLTVKGQELTRAEKRDLLGLLCGFSPEEIATGACTVLGSVSVNLSKYVYRYIEELTGREKKALKSWRDITVWLEAAGYKNFESWDEAPVVPVFYGRREKLNQLKKMIIGDGSHASLSQSCRLIMLGGRTGMGKTAMAIKLADQIQPSFHYRIWQPLRHKPPLESIIDRCLKLLSKSQEERLVSLSTKISSLIQCLRNRRCLIVLDELDAIFEAGQMAGQYREGYENYGEFFRRIGQEPHQSCLVLTSRASTTEIEVLQGDNRPIRVINLEGLEPEAARAILREDRLLEEFSEADYWGQLIQLYQGNPQSLKLVSSRIKRMYMGEVSAFLKRGSTLIRSMTDLHERIFEALSSLEQEILRALAREGRTTVSFSELEGLLPTPLPNLDDALDSLIARSLIEQSRAGYTLPPDFMEYVNTYKS
jgi:hypothetical protein